MRREITEKDFNERILPILENKTKHNRQKISYYKVFVYVIQVLTTGGSWRSLIIENQEVTWENIYYHFRKWTANEVFEKLFKASLSWEDLDLDLSILQIDGTHTPSKKGAKT